MATRIRREIIASIKKGLYASNFGGGQVDITSGKFVFSASEAYWVEDGKIQYPVKGATIVGSGPESLKKVTMIGNDMRLDSGVGTCGKEGQSVPVGVGSPRCASKGLRWAAPPDQPDDRQGGAASAAVAHWLHPGHQGFAL